jgi:hypothetical protein
MSLLAAAHPSFGASQATFMFAISAPGGGIRRVLLVAAKNALAVQFVERLVAADNRVSDNCFLLTVHRETTPIGMRSDLVEEVPYAQFVTDIVDPERVVADPSAEVAMCMSLSEEEKAMVEMAIMSRRHLQSSRTDSRAMSLPPAEAAADRPGASHDRSRLQEALSSLGLKRDQVSTLSRELDGRIGREPVEDLVKAALVMIQSR